MVINRLMGFNLGCLLVHADVGACEGFILIIGRSTRGILNFEFETEHLNKI